MNDKPTDAALKDARDALAEAFTWVPMTQEIAAELHVAAVERLIRVVLSDDAAGAATPPDARVPKVGDRVRPFGYAEGEVLTIMPNGDLVVQGNEYRLRFLRSEIEPVPAPAKVAEAEREQQAALFGDHFTATQASDAEVLADECKELRAELNAANCRFHGAEARAEAAEAREARVRVAAGPIVDVAKRLLTWSDVETVSIEIGRIRALLDALSPAGKADGGGEITDDLVMGVDAVRSFLQSERAKAEVTPDPSRVELLIRHIERLRTAIDVMEARPRSPAPADGGTDMLIASILRDVAELPDRTSPEDDPEMMWVSGNELSAILRARLSEQKP